jgi:hypothetical protein
VHFLALANVQASESDTGAAMNGLVKHEGNITMHTANSTAFPQHRPGEVAPGPFDLPAGELPSRLGIRTGRHRPTRPLSH